MPSLHEYIGSIHLHTIASDGTADFQEIARLASEAGLDFLIPTDHNVLVKGKDGWYGHTLLLIGEEIHDVERAPEANHYLAFNIREDVAAYAKDLPALIEAVNAQGGFGFLAHPFEHATAYSGEPELPWVDWGIEGYAGLEIWNYMSEFKAYLPNLPTAFILAYFSSLAIWGPFPETLAKWDELLERRKVAIIGGSDAHGVVYTLGPLKRAIHSYQHCLRTIRTHIMAPEPFNRDIEHDATLVYEALREGRSFVAYDLIGDSRGFLFAARGGNREAIMGEEIPLEHAIEFEVVSPLPALLRLVHRGKVVSQKRGKTLRYRSEEKGAYRVEAYRRYLLRRRGWVFTNPIYVV